MLALGLYIWLGFPKPVRLSLSIEFALLVWFIVEVWYLLGRVAAAFSFRNTSLSSSLAFKMTARFAVVTFACLWVQLSGADLTPTAPGPGQTFAAGNNCTIAWTADDNELWSNVSIGELLCMHVGIG